MARRSSPNCPVPNSIPSNVRITALTWLSALALFMRCTRSLSEVNSPAIRPKGSAHRRLAQRAAQMKMGDHRRRAAFLAVSCASEPKHAGHENITAAATATHNLFAFRYLMIAHLSNGSRFRIATRVNDTPAGTPRQDADSEVNAGRLRWHGSFRPAVASGVHTAPRSAQPIRVSQPQPQPNPAVEHRNDGHAPREAQP